jgi:DNA-binding MarR family transcriptional regulator
MSDAELAAALMRGLMKLGRRIRTIPGDRVRSLSLSSVSILGALVRFGAMPAARLAEEQRLQPQSLTRLIAELEKKKLITRTRDREDGRVLVLSINPEGRALLREEMRARRLWLSQAMAELTEAERATLKHAAKLMERVAGYEGPEKALDL